MGRLTEKVAIITGGGGGIGRATAIRFAEEGARVIVADIDILRGEESAKVAKEAAGNGGGDAIFIETDVTCHESVKAAVAEAVGRFGKLDILHNNAGGSTMEDGPVTEAPDEEFWRVIKLDLFGTFVCSKHGIPAIMRRYSRLSRIPVRAPDLVFWPLFHETDGISLRVIDRYHPQLVRLSS